MTETQAPAFVDVDVFKALLNDPNLSAYWHLPMLLAELPFLPARLGPLLDEQVTYKRLLMVQANLFEAALETDFGDNRYARDVRIYLETQVEKIWRRVIRDGEELDQHEKYLLGTNCGFDLDVERRYLSNFLTVRELLELQPGVLIPVHRL